MDEFEEMGHVESGGQADLVPIAEEVAVIIPLYESFEQSVMPPVESALQDLPLGNASFVEETLEKESEPSLENEAKKVSKQLYRRAAIPEEDQTV